MSLLPTMGLHTSPGLGPVTTRPTEVLVWPELVPPTQGADPGVSFVVPNGPRRFYRRLEETARRSRDRVKESHSLSDLNQR
jgi:hypothetical protein